MVVADIDDTAASRWDADHVLQRLAGEMDHTVRKTGLGIIKSEGL